MSWDDYSYRERDDRQIPAEDKPVGGPRRKKDTKRWCKGKEGRAHQTEIRMSHWGYRTPCGPAPEWARGRSHWFYGGDGTWWCMHQEVCTICGKVIRRKIGADECPDRTDA